MLVTVQLKILHDGYAHCFAETGLFGNEGKGGENTTLLLFSGNLHKIATLKSLHEE